MMLQLRLPGVDPPHQVRPSNGRRAPLFWVRRIRVLRELKPGADHVIRDVELRRGLNIIWAAPHAASSGTTLFQNGVSGHTAGKTTFCRLVRHALGERGFATEETRRRIREMLPSGWVVAEVLLDGEPWTVARPFGVGPHPFCIRGGSIDQAAEGEERKDYQLFVDAIGGLTVDRLSARRFPASNAPVRWEHVLPWLSRDQECRFADFLEWRHSSSNASAPLLSVDERQFVVRSVLGLISDQERQEQQTNARLVAQRRTAAEEQPLLSHQSHVDHVRAGALLGVELEPPSTGLFGSQAHAELERLAKDLTERERELGASDRREELRAALEQAIAAQTNAQRDLQDIEGRLHLEEALLGQLAGNGQAALLAGLPPARDHCDVPMTIAREKACPIARSRPLELAERRGERSAAEELEHQRVLVGSLQGLTEEKRRAFAQTQEETQAARRAFMSAATAFEEQRGRLLGERARISQIERLVGDADKAWLRASEHAAAITRISAEIEESYARQDQLRREGQEAMGRFSSEFDYVVRAFLGEEVTGEVDTSGRSLSLLVDQHGQRDSAAIATVKLLAFDLAALTSSIEGHGAFPRFLIHDGPREADMAPDIYERLFLFARELEKCFEGEPSFQYIVTTTTRPPEEFLIEPWLRLTLAGVPAEERLLRCDL